jgi:hypothetical protein
LLDVSRERVYELMELGKLTRYEFTGRTYLSYAEVYERREADIKAGRPRRGILETMVVGLKAAAKSDKAQLKQSGFAGPVHNPKRKRKN